MSTLNIFGMTPLGFKERTKLDYKTYMHDDGSQIQLSRMETDKRDYNVQNIYWGNMNYYYSGAHGLLADADYCDIQNWGIVNSTNSTEFSNNIANLYRHSNNLIGICEEIPCWVSDAGNAFKYVYSDETKYSVPIPGLKYPKVNMSPGGHASEMFCNSKGFHGEAWFSNDVTNADSMYWRGYYLTKQYMTDYVVDCNSMYRFCYNLQGPPLVGAGVLNTHNMFSSCTNMHGKLDLRGHVAFTDCHNMFERCTDIWINVTDGSAMDVKIYTTPGFAGVGWMTHYGTDSIGPWYGNTPRNIRVYHI